MKQIEINLRISHEAGGFDWQVETQFGDRFCHVDLTRAAGLAVQRALLTRIFRDETTPLTNEIGPEIRT